MSSVRFAVVSMSARSPEGRDAEYLEWHGLDHHPEQYGIDGIRLGQRWVSTPACRAVRAVDHPRFAEVDHVMQYLFADPLDASIDEFFRLGNTLHKAGRMPIRIPAVELGGWNLTERAAAASALVRPEVVPWRPARGAYLAVEAAGPASTVDDLCAVPGVAGAWRYRGGVFHDRLVDTTGLILTVLYLDGDPVETGASLQSRPWAEPLLAAPFEAVVPWAWDRALP